MMATEPLSNDVQDPRGGRHAILTEIRAAD
jgi:hypothetical protein